VIQYAQGTVAGCLVMVRYQVWSIAGPVAILRMERRRALCSVCWNIDHVRSLDLEALLRVAAQLGAPVPIAFIARPDHCGIDLVVGSCVAPRRHAGQVCLRAVIRVAGKAVRVGVRIDIVG